ncbi:cytochrome c oxidase subunit 3 [Haloferula sargassicola]|uniref:Heme-copper oxidase subunit III family profile domain-containing protein n=1 Tax=Haloferula sargassicola TaxID=490096 RepID=A0ABP9URL7_9BACT
MEIPYVVTPRKDTGLFNSKIAIWLFLASEVMLFGGLFSGYVFLRLGADYPWPERTIPVLPGLLNTFILIASSVTVVFAWAALKMRQWIQFKIFMGITILCALVFMGFKSLEYYVKFHHQAARLVDYTMVEGHIDHEVKGGGEHGEHAEHVLDASGNEVEMNVRRFVPQTITFDLLRFHKPWVEEMLAEAGESGSTIQLADKIDFNRADAESADSSKVFAAGETLSVDLLKRLAAKQTENHAFNQSKRTEYLRRAWDIKWENVKENNLLGEAAFVASFPAGSELEPEERAKAYTRWKAGMRANFATDVTIDSVKLGNGESVPVVIDYKKFSDIERPEVPSASFTVGGAPLTLRFGNHDVITDYRDGLTSISLRDGTALAGEQGNSTMVYHYVDGIDFQYLVEMAEKKGIDPLIAIENSWIVKDNPEIAEIWEMHKEGVRQLEEVLHEEGREPTPKDRYRMGWQELAYYTRLIDEGKGVEDVKIDPKAKTPPREDIALIEHFKGPDYSRHHFPHLEIPRAEVALASKFTPRWNTYYAIYFTITGLHGLHVVGGAIVLGYYFFFGRRMYLSNPEWLANRVEVGGLFWHFVDLVWIFAFPIFYLM